MSPQLPLHLAIRPLNICDAEQVLRLEKKGFSKSEACSAEGIRYRLLACPELCSGIFIRRFSSKYAQFDKDLENDLDTTVTQNYSSKPIRNVDLDYLPDEKSSTVEEKLIGHIMATKINGEFITTESMALPKDDNDAINGHQESSITIGLHSLVIDPEYRGKHLGILLLHDYVQKLSNQRVAKYLTLLCKKKL
ncbi:polyamine acetyltransferase ASCRUDRAFT_73417, partial [Ascoidea rubescens DSM 1968]